MVKTPGPQHGHSGPRPRHHTPAAELSREKIAVSDVSVMGAG